MNGVLFHNRLSGRMEIADEMNPAEAIELHCGNTFQLQIENQWCDVRIEHCQPEGWCLVGIPRGFHSGAGCYVGQKARTYAR
jgi:hypothetical protein